MLKRFIAIMLLAVLLAGVFSAASAASGTVKLSVEKKAYIAPGEAQIDIGITASEKVKKAVAFSYSIDGEVFESAIEAGTNKTYISFPTPKTEAVADKEFVLLKGDGYARGNDRAKIRLIPDPSFRMSKGGVTVAPAGDAIRAEFEIQDKKVLSTGLKLELRDESGNTLASGTFSKDYPLSSLKFTVPKTWTGVNPVSLWFGDKKLSEDYLVIIRKNDTVIRSIATDEKKIVITVDCGGGTDYHISKWLDLLDEYDAKATFFMTGYFLENNPTAAAQVLARGHDVGNHSMTHQKLSDKKFDVVSEEVEGVNRLIYEQTDGYVPVYFRAPYGSWSYSMNTMVDYMNLATIQWEVSSNDSDKAITNKKVFNNVTGKKLQPGAIFLFHNASPCFGVMDEVFDYYRERGYRMVSLSMLMPEEYTIDADGVVWPKEK